MADELFDFLSSTKEEDEQKIYGVALAKVINNVDITGETRVQLELPWLPGFNPWARIATPTGGLARGFFFIPQINDEVLVAFNQGDVREPFVVGSLWNRIDRSPALLPSDTINKRIIRTPLGQEIVFDELKSSVTITNTNQQTLSLDPIQAELSAGTVPPMLKASISLDIKGNVTIHGTTGITLKAPLIQIEGDIVNIKGSASTTVEGGAECVIKGLMVKIN